MIDRRRGDRHRVGTWRHHNPVEVWFGSGEFDTIAALMSEEPLLVVMSPGGKRRGLLTRLQNLLGRNDFFVIDDVAAYPEVRQLQDQVDKVPTDVQQVIGIGGGSVLDTAKVIGALLGDGLKEKSVRGVLGSDRGAVVRGGLPVIAVPTTAGTGSEVTPFATIWDLERKKKHSLTGPGMHPRFAVVDPELTLTVPPAITISTGLDALSQGLEAVWNRNATPISDTLAVRSVVLALETLKPLSDAPAELGLRGRMMEASLLAGLAISETRTALAHSISYPLTAHFGVPHGLACSFTLPAILQFNATGASDRFQALIRTLALPSVSALEGRLIDLLRDLGVKREFETQGVDCGSLSKLGPEMITPGRAENNLRDVTVEQAVHLACRSLKLIE